MMDERILRAESALNEIVQTLSQPQPLSRDERQAMIQFAIEAREGLRGLREESADD